MICGYMARAAQVELHLPAIGAGAISESAHVPVDKTEGARAIWIQARRLYLREKFVAKALTLGL